MGVDARLRATRRPHAGAWLCRDARGRDDGVREKLAAGMTQKRRTYLPRIVGDKVMMAAYPKRLHKYRLSR
jgi:hypothetical protein